MKGFNNFLLVMLVFQSLPVHASQTIGSLSELAEAVEKNNLSIQSALWDREKKENNITSLITWEDSSLSLTQSYDESSSDELATAGRLNLSVLEAVSLYGETDFEGSGEAGISLSPLWHSDDRQQDLLDLSAAEETVTATVKSVQHTSAEAYLNWSLASMTHENNKKTALLNKALYEDEKVRYDLGESTLDDVREALIDWSESRTNLSLSQSTLQSRKQSLFEISGLDFTEFEMVPADSDSVLAEIEALEKTLTSASLGIQNLESVRKKIISNRSLETEWNDIRVIDPQLSIEASWNWNDSDESWISASAGISFALDDYNRQEKQETREDLRLEESALSQLMQYEELRLQQYTEAVETADLDYELALLEREQSELLVLEGRYLLETGDLSERELEKLTLDNQNSRINVFDTLIQKFLALSILQYYI